MMGRIVAAVMLAVSLNAATPAPSASPEARTAGLFLRLREDEAARRLFLQGMPKGGDLHNHLGGSTYAEDLLAWADALGLCVSTEVPAITPPPCDGKGSVPAKGIARRGDGLYARLIDGLSMRGVDPGGAPVTGHDRFFASFARFGLAAQRSTGAVIATALESAALDHTLYVEAMILPPAIRGVVVAAGSSEDAAPDLAALAARIAGAIPAAVAQARSDLDAAEAEAARLNRCATPSPAPACSIAIRYQMSALRTLPPAAVFAQLAFGFALGEADPRVVGVNLVAPEDDPVARADYAAHMAMIRWLAARHPGVKVSLHAGELALGLVPPRDLADHIAQAVTVAGARRIGHGVDIAHETDAAGLLRRMARDRVAVEIALTSNDVILGVTRERHPLNLYRRAGVPVVLATDDAGVSRIDLTNEYLRAATEHGLGYPDLKAISRASLEYAFLPGASLWRDPVRFVAVAACPLGRAPDAACRRLLAASPRAALQWRLEQEFARFEADSGALAATLGR